MSVTTTKSAAAAVKHGGGFHLHDVQLRQQVAVGQGELSAVQEGARRGSDLVGAVCVDLVRERRAEVVVQFLQSLQKAFL